MSDGRTSPTGMNRPASAVVSGVVGTAAMSVIFVLLEVQTRYVLRIFYVIARFVRQPDEPFVGFLVFALVGVVVWPLLFVALRDYVPYGPDPAVQGMVFALPLWVAFAVTGRGDIGPPILWFYAGITLLAHLVYGFVVGAVFASLYDDVETAEIREAPRSRDT